MRTKKEIEQDISDLKEAIAVTDDKEEKDMLKDGLAEYEKELSEAKEEVQTPTKKKSKKKATKAPKKVKEKTPVKVEEEKPQPKDRSGVKIVEKDGVTLVSLESEPQWVVNIVEKNGKFKADCCSDDEVEIKSSTDINEVIDDAIEYLQCKKMFKATKEQRKIAKKRRDSRVKAGKPAEKTPGETADDAAKKVVDKIEKKANKTFINENI